MEAEGAASLTEVGDGSPLSGAAASEETETVIGVGYGMEAGDMGNALFIMWTLSWDASHHIKLQDLTGYRLAGLVTVTRAS